MTTAARYDLAAAIQEDLRAAADLRDTSRKRPDLVADWLEPRAARASGVTVREAVKYLQPAQRERIRALHLRG